MAITTQVRHYRPLEKIVGYSQAVVSGNFLFLSGMVSYDIDGNCVGKDDMAAQVTHIYKEIEEVLRDYGLTYAAVVRETIYTVDLDALVEAAPIRLKFFDYPDVSPPAATWVQVARLFRGEFLLEVEITAQLPSIRG